MATDLMRLLTGAQGSMGIVVWASIKCELLPTVKKCLAVSAPQARGPGGLLLQDGAVAAGRRSAAC